MRQECAHHQAERDRHVERGPGKFRAPDDDIHVGPARDEDRHAGRREEQRASPSSTREHPPFLARGNLDVPSRPGHRRAAPARGPSEDRVEHRDDVDQIDQIAGGDAGGGHGDGGDGGEELHGLRQTLDPNGINLVAKVQLIQLGNVLVRLEHDSIIREVLVLPSFNASLGSYT